MTFFSGCVMKVPEIMEKIVEKIREMKGLNYVPVHEATFGIKIRVELNEEQFNKLLDMLKSEGFKIGDSSVNDGGDITEIYNKDDVHEVVAIEYLKGEKYLVGNIIYYWKEQ